MLKKFLLLLSLVLCQALVFSTSAFTTYARGIEDGIFDITNPETNASVIVNKDGKILLKSIDPSNENIYIVYDLFTDKPSYLAKVFSGEEKVTRTVTYSKDEEWSYSDPSERVVLYDLNGEEIGFEVAKGYGSVSSVGDKIVCAIDDESIIYDIKTKEQTKIPFRGLAKCGNVAISYSYSSDDKGITIYDKNMKEIKKYPDYSYYYSISYEDTLIHRVRHEIEEDKYVYNYLDDDGNFLFDRNVENNIVTINKNPVADIIIGDTIAKYDFVKKSYVASPSTISKEEKEKLLTEKEDAFQEEKNDNIDKIRQQLSDYEDVYVYNNTYNGRYIYIASYNGRYEIATPSDADKMLFSEIADKYVMDYNVYDNNLKLVAEKVNNVMTSLCDYGYFGVGGVIYDFYGEEVLKLDKEVDFIYEKINDKVYFVDRWLPNYEINPSMTVYDDKFNILYEEIKDFAYMTNNDIVFMTDSASTKIYDKEFNVIKDLGIKTRTTYNYTDQYYTLADLDTTRELIVDKEGKVLVSGLKDITRMDDEYFVYQNGFKYGVMKYDGEVVVSLSIFDTMKEDANPRDYDSYDIITD